MCEFCGNKHSRPTGTPTLPTVADVIAATNSMLAKARDPMQGRKVVAAFLTPRSPDGKSGGEVIKVVSEANDLMQGRKVLAAFLSPSVDGKPGEVIKVVSDGKEERQFAVPTPYWETDKK